MQFNSLTYIAFFAAVLLLYTLIPKKGKVFFLAASSYVFYYSFSPILAALLFALTISTYALAILIERSAGKRRHLALYGGLLLTLGSLFYFKYFDFFAHNLNSLFHTTYFKSHLVTVETVGLSFIVFQITSYLLDVFYKTILAEKSFIDYAMYVSFFPKLLQGPLERASDFLPQIKNLKTPPFENFKTGLFLIVWGLFLKMVVADRIGDFYVNPVYANIGTSSRFEILVAVYFYTLQIYLDFSGYTKVAIGTARCFGINLSENFNRPLLATSCTDFWRRWHMTFSGWLRDYLFLPLQMQFRRFGIHGAAMAILITFALAGLWHGASWGFVIFGLIHGVWLSIEQYAHYLLKKRKKLKSLIATPPAHYIKLAGTYSLLSFAFVFFRAPNIKSALAVLGSLSRIGIDLRQGMSHALSGFGSALFRSNAEGYSQVGIFNFSVLLIALFIVGVAGFFGKSRAFHQMGVISQWLIAEFLMVSIVLFGVLSGSGYAYFKF